MPRGSLTQRKDPLAQLDAAMEETFSEIEQSGSGVEVADIVGTGPNAPPARSTSSQTATPGRTAPRRSPPPVDPEREPIVRQSGRDARGRFLPSDADADDDAPWESVLVDDAEPSGRSRRPAPTDTDDDILSRYDGQDVDEGDDDDQSYVAGYADAEEVGDDDDRAEPESSRTRASADPTEEAAPERRQPRLSKSNQRLVDQAVRAQVASVLQERDQLRAREAQQHQALSQNQAFFRSVLGTEEQLAQLQQAALNTSLAVPDRNLAAATYQRYVDNRKFAAMYQQGIMTIIQNQQAEDDAKALKSFGKLQPLDPAIVAEGNRAKTMVHAYRVGMQAAERELRKKYAERFRRLERENETLRGSRDESRIRGGMRRSGGTIADARGRRANGRIGKPDALRGAMTFQRGIDPNSRVPMPTDELLKRIKDGELTLADIGLRSAS